jgi:hypothetical protein
MTSSNTIDAARVELLLSELRLPGVKLMWSKFVNGARNLPTCGGSIFPTWAGMVISP